MSTTDSTQYDGFRVGDRVEVSWPGAPLNSRLGGKIAALFEENDYPYAAVSLDASDWIHTPQHETSLSFVVSAIVNLTRTE